MEEFHLPELLIRKHLRKHLIKALHRKFSPIHSLAKEGSIPIKLDTTKEEEESSS